jgi:hypothetical protein
MGWVNVWESLGLEMNRTSQNEILSFGVEHDPSGDIQPQWEYTGSISNLCVYIYIYNGIYNQVDDGNFWNVGKLHMWISP